MSNEVAAEETPDLILEEKPIPGFVRVDLLPQEIIEKVEAALPDEDANVEGVVNPEADPQLAQTQPLPRFSFDEETQAGTDSEQADDSDMLICDTEQKAKAPEEKPVTGQPPSTGQVIRMNYEDLFQQLRNNNPNNQT